MRKLVSVAAMAAAMISSAVFAEDIAITGGKAFTKGGSGEVENATILVSDGKIVSVASGGAVPASYRVIDASGKWVTAGFMAGDTTIGLVEVALSGGVVDTRTTAKDGIGLNAAYAINPASPLFANARIDGVTRAMTRTSSSADMWMGQGAIVKLTDDDVVVKESAFLGLDLDEGSATSNGGSRAALWSQVHAKFEEAMRKKGSGTTTKSEGKSDAKPKKPSPAEVVMTKVMNKQMPVYATVERKTDILQLIALKKRFDIDVILGGAGEAWMVADELAAANIPVVLEPSMNLPGNFDTLGRTSAGAARLHAAGVKVAFIPPRTHNTALVVQNAGIAVSMGMPWAAAVDALTVNPAEIFGIDDTYGTLTEGMEADIVVWDGDPLEVMSSPDAVLIAGEEMPMVSRLTKLRDRYKDLDRAPAFDRP